MQSVYIARQRRSGAREISSMTSPGLSFEKYVHKYYYKQNAIIYPHILTLLLRKFFCPNILNLLPVGIRQFAVSFFFPNIFYICRIEKKVGPTEIWTRIAGFKVQSANHYTMGPFLFSLFNFVEFQSQIIHMARNQLK